MKKLVIVTTVFGLLVLSVGCSQLASDQTADSTTAEVSVSTAVQHDNVTTSQTQRETTEGATVPSSDSGAVYGDKKDVALLKSIGESLEPPETIYTKSIIKMNVPDYGEMIVEQVNYKQGESYYAESQNSMMGDKVYINIFDAETHYAYDYVKGETTGKKYLVSDNFTQFDSPLDLGVEIDDVIAEDSYENLVTARIEKLDGDDVVYIEARDDMENIGLATTKMWYSLKYRHPIKWLLITEDGSEYASYVVEEIAIDKDFSSHIVVPDDVEFTEY